MQAPHLRVMGELLLDRFVMRPRFELEAFPFLNRDQVLVQPLGKHSGMTGENLLVRHAGLAMSVRRFENAPVYQVLASMLLCQRAEVGQDHPAVVRAHAKIRSTREPLRSARQQDQSGREKR